MDYRNGAFKPAAAALTILAILSAILLLQPTCLAAMDFVRVDDNGGGFALDPAGTAFTPWGVNYDHDADGRLIEDYWRDEWPTVEQDFREIKDLGANVVRIHLQFGKFMPGPNEPDSAQLARLSDLLKLAEKTGLHLDLTGLACYHKKDVPAWYDKLPESERWDMQAKFWEAVAGVCADSPAVFCYDLMNEPVVSGEKAESDWLLGELGGSFFVQRLNLQASGRTSQQIAKAWVDKMVAAVRKHDRRHLVTVGVIPWATVWPTAKPLFYSPRVCENLDFACVHFYPESGKLEKALAALKVYDVGKPLVVEEMFPMKCSAEQLRQFVLASRGVADGWISFYWGRTIEQYETDKGIGPAIIKGWLTTFKRLGKEVMGPATRYPGSIEPPHGAELALDEDWSSGKIDRGRWYMLQKLWGSGNNGVMPQNVEVEKDAVFGHSRNVVVCYGNGDEYTGPVVGWRGRHGRVGGVIVSKGFFASGQYEVVMKIGSPDKDAAGPKDPTKPIGMVPAIWTYAYRWVQTDKDKASAFNADIPLYNPYMNRHGWAANEYWSELDFPEFGKAQKLETGMYNTFLNADHNSLTFSTAAAVDGQYHTFTTIWRTQLLPMEGVRDGQVVEYEGYYWVADKAVPFESYRGNPLKKLGSNRYGLYAGKSATHYIDGIYVGENTRFVPAMAAQLNIGVWFPGWAGKAPWSRSSISIASVRIWRLDDPGDVTGILTKDITANMDEKGAPLKK